MSPDFDELPDDVFSLKTRILLHMKRQKIDQRISELVRTSFEEAMRTEKIVLSHAEYDHLRRIILKDFLAEILAGM